MSFQQLPTDALWHIFEIACDNAITYATIRLVCKKWANVCTIKFPSEKFMWFSIDTSCDFWKGSSAFDFLRNYWSLCNTRVPIWMSEIFRVHTSFIGHTVTNDLKTYVASTPINYATFTHFDWPKNRRWAVCFFKNSHSRQHYRGRQTRPHYCIEFNDDDVERVWRDALKGGKRVVDKHLIVGSRSRKTALQVPANQRLWATAQGALAYKPSLNFY